MNDNRNMILAIVLSALVLIGWSLVSDRLLPTAGPPTSRVEDGKVKPLPQPQASPAPDTPQAMRNRAVVMRDTPRVLVDTPSLKGSINLKGARFDDLVLVRQRDILVHAVVNIAVEFIHGRFDLLVVASIIMRRRES